MLRKIRYFVGVFVLLSAVLLFADISNLSRDWLGWVAKIQFIPALLALNFAIVAALLFLTILFGRIYCSAICPLGIFQDAVIYFKRRKKPNKFSYSPEMKFLRYGVFALFVLAMIFGLNMFVALLAPYSSFGRIASNIFAPVLHGANNALAFLADKFGSFAFGHYEIRVAFGATFLTALITFAVIIYLAYKKGRIYCNTLCPVGTLLGLFSRFSLFKPAIDLSKCNSCGLCARNCKSECINSKEHKIDYSRCVVCLDCVSNCRQGAIKYSFLGGGRKREQASAHVGALKNPTAKTDAKKGETNARNDSSKFANARRGFFAILFSMLGAKTLDAQVMKLDGGLAELKKRELPKRSVMVLPAGAQSEEHMKKHCTACQLCVQACPYQALAPSGRLDTFMQPQMAYERGYCRIDCTKCSEVCPTGAIKKILPEDKSSIQTGRAVWISANCVVNTDKLQCDNCYRHCPAAAIEMVLKNPKDKKSLKIPVVNEARCIGCGACENLCPARPFTAIYVEGNAVQHRV